jgi:hypothetical protein
MSEQLAGVLGAGNFACCLWPDVSELNALMRRARSTAVQSILAPRMIALTNELRNAKALPAGCVPDADVNS